MLHYSHNGVNWNQHIQAGIRVHEDQIDRYQWVDLYGMDQGIMELQMTGTAGSESNRLVTADALAAYLQYTLRRGQWTLTPGLRLEDITKTEKNYGTLDRSGCGAHIEEYTLYTLLYAVFLFIICLTFYGFLLRFFYKEVNIFLNYFFLSFFVYCRLSFQVFRTWPNLM